MNDIAKLLAAKKGYTTLVEAVTSELSGTEFNTLLLSLFQARSRKIKKHELVHQMQKNRFCIPSPVDAIAFKELEIKWLKSARDSHFEILTLSPLAPIGTCSVVGKVAQNNIVSALRGTEVVSDITNVIALLIAQQWKNKKRNDIIKYAATHRLVRAQALNNPAFSAHFGIFCMVTGDMDTGDYHFEIENIFDHLHVHLNLLSKEFKKEKLITKIYVYDNEKLSKGIRDRSKPFEGNFKINVEDTKAEGDYYQSARFKIFLEHKGMQVNLTDGGFVDWTQQLIPNKKHRLIISGSGLEIIYKIINENV